jgi:hypothetical protein
MRNSFPGGGGSAPETFVGLTFGKTFPESKARSFELLRRGVARAPQHHRAPGFSALVENRVRNW